VPYNVRYHYPSEHLLNGTRYDLEMQVVHADPQKRGVLCNGTAVVSMFFNINDTAPDTGFFDWQANATNNGDVYLNMSKLAPKSSAMFTNIQGYYGTDSMPDCPYITCWYLVEQVIPITTA